MIRAAIHIGIAALWIGIGATASGQPGHRDPVLDDPDSAQRVAELLAEFTTRDALSRFVGAPAQNCVSIAAASEICEWHLSKAESGFAALSQAIDTEDRVALLCEMSSDGGERSREACRAYPRRSNRVDWYVQRRPGNKRTTSREKQHKTRMRYQRMATEALDSARTLSELSGLLGAVPSECTLSGEQRLCVWRATSRTYGHGTLSVAADESKSKKLRLHCALPADGGPRAADSCQIEIGA